MAPIIVIGGGPSGMMAAGQATISGRKVILLEKTSRLGNKLAICGKGRGNLTNLSDLHDFIGHFNRPGRFLHQPFSRFFVDDLIRFFEDLDVPLARERGGRIFPRSGRANDIVEVLARWLEKSGVEVRYNCRVEKLVIGNGRLKGIRCNDTMQECEAAILACGGASYPATGSTGDGYRLAKSCGHTIISPRPALVPLTVDHPQVHTLTGLDLKNIAVRIYINTKRKVNDFGEISFNRSGVGGPVVLTHSRLVVDSLAAGKKVAISLDLKPALDERKLDNRLQRDFQQRTSERINSVLRGLLPKALVSFCLQECAIDPGKAAGRINGEERLRLRSWLKDFRLTINGHRPLAEAMVTAGGVTVAEVDPSTMESKCVKGLYFCGELLDVDADTGGYNLQAAFSTGWLAGRSVAARQPGPTP